MVYYLKCLIDKTDELAALTPEELAVLSKPIVVQETEAVSIYKQFEDAQKEIASLKMQLYHAQNESVRPTQPSPNQEAVADLQSTNGQQWFHVGCHPFRFNFLPKSKLCHHYHKQYKQVHDFTILPSIYLPHSFYIPNVIRANL